MRKFILLVLLIPFISLFAQSGQQIVASSATPVFDCQNYLGATMTMNQNVTSFTMTPGNFANQQCLITIVNPSTYTVSGSPSNVGGNTFVWPNATTRIQMSYDPLTSMWIGTPTGNSNSSLMYGTPVVATGLSGALSTQTICGANPFCPAGFYRLDIYVNVTSAATLGSLSSITVTYTDDTGSTTQIPPNCATLSLISTVRCSTSVNFYHAANTAVTVNTNVGAITGSPSYNFRAVLIKEQ